MLKDFFRSLVPNFERSRIIEEYELARKSLIEETLPPYKTAAENKLFIGNNPFKSPAIKRINALYIRETGARSNFVNSLAMVISNLAEGMPNLEAALDSSFKTEAIMKNGLTYNKISLMRVVSLINFFSLYSRRVLLYTYGKEIPELGKDYGATVEPFTKGEVKWLEDHLVNFCRCAKVFAQPMRQVLNTLESVPDIVYDPGKEDDVNAMVGKQKVDPLRMGFVPVVSDIIWFIGSHYVEYQAESFKRAKEERRALELRLAQMMAAKQGQGDAAQDKVIEVTEQRLRDLNYKISKWEREYGV
nr:MAG TPA: hypothetical protein [Caudoviricetes sp.]